MPPRSQSVFLGALVGGVLSTSYLGFINVVCCLGVIIGALVSVWHYTTTNRLTIAGGVGAGMGATVGVLAAVISGVLTLFLAPLGLDTTAAVTDFMLDTFGDQMDSSQRQQLEDQRDAGTSPGAMVLGTVISAIIFAVFGAIGGAIGAAVFKKGGATPVGPEPI
jgi:hypothetical protein